MSPGVPNNQEIFPNGPLKRDMLNRSREMSKANLKTAQYYIPDSATQVLFGSRSTTSNLRDDIQQIKFEHLSMNLNRKLNDSHEKLQTTQQV